MKHDAFVKERLIGPLVPVMPAFTKNGTLDTDSTRRHVQWCMDRGIRNFWTTAGTSHYFCLTDEEVIALNQEIAAITKGRAVFMAGTPYHWSTKAVLDFCDLMKSSGADIVKVQVGWQWNPSQQSVYDFYHDIVTNASLPVLAYTLGKPGITPDLLTRLLELENLVGMKNDSGDFYENCQYWNRVQKSGRAFQVITGGTMSAFFHGRHFGQTIFADVVAMYAPDVTFDFIDHLDENRDEQAVQLMKTYEEPLIHGGFYEFSGLYWTIYHAILYQLGIFADQAVRFPMVTMDESFETIRPYIPKEQWHRFRGAKDDHR